MTSPQTLEALAARALTTHLPDRLLEGEIAEACGWTRSGYHYTSPEGGIRVAGPPKCLEEIGAAASLLPTHQALYIEGINPVGHNRVEVVNVEGEVYTASCNAGAPARVVTHLALIMRAQALRDASNAP